MQEEKKYQLTNEMTDYYGETLYRIQALKDFGDVKAGDKGGWVKNGRNLSQFDNCWIYDESMVYGNSHVMGNAKILNDSEICEFACVAGNAIINQGSKISGNVFIEDAKLTDLEIKSPRDFYTFKLWYPYDEFVTYLPNHNKFSYCGETYTKEELAKHDDFGQESSIILEILNKIVDLCNYYKEVYL